MKSHLAWLSHKTLHTPSAARFRVPGNWRAFMMLLVPLSLLIFSPCRAEQIEPGRLFYTPAQRAQLETARARNVTQIARPKQDVPVSASAPIRFDGVVIRSDGQSTRWVDGKAEIGTPSVKGLKPGQTRVNGKVYEPYQVLRPTPAARLEQGAKESTR